MSEEKIYQKWRLLLAYDAEGAPMIQLADDDDWTPPSDWDYEPVRVRKVLFLDPYNPEEVTKITLPESQEGEVKVEEAI